MMIRIAILVVTCWSIVTSRGIPLSSKWDKSSPDLLDEEMSNGFDFLGAVGIDSQGSVKTGVTKVNGSCKDATVFRISPEARLRMPTRSIFPKGFPAEFSLQVLLRAREPKAIERWELIRIEGPSGRHQFGIIIYGVKGVIKVYTSYYKRNAINSIYFYDAPLLKKLFDGQWHKLEFSFTRDKLELYVDCELKASRELDESDSININVNGEIVVAVKADGTSPMVDLHSVMLQCDPAIPEKRRCDDIERLWTSKPAEPTVATMKTTAISTTPIPSTEEKSDTSTTRPTPTTAEPKTTPTPTEPKTTPTTEEPKTTPTPTEPKTTPTPTEPKTTPTTAEPKMEEVTVGSGDAEPRTTLTATEEVAVGSGDAEPRTTAAAAEPKMEEVAVGSGDAEPRATSTTAEPTTEEVAVGSGDTIEPVEKFRVNNHVSDKPVTSVSDRISTKMPLKPLRPVFHDHDWYYRRYIARRRYPSHYYDYRYDYGYDWFNREMPYFHHRFHHRRFL